MKLWSVKGKQLNLFKFLSENNSCHQFQYNATAKLYTWTDIYEHAIFINKSTEVELLNETNAVKKTHPVHQYIH